ncbi:MAG: IclR family transcriptional regulator [Actinobacteria bacterium]|nr:IclR family transcriptional regulator [Actinomycetota bacterium]
MAQLSGPARPRRAAPPRDDAPSAKRSYFIDSLGRGLSVIDAFTPERPELTLRDLADAAGVSQPSAFRIGYTLVEMGYLVRNPVTKGYRLGPRVITAGLATLASLVLPEIAEPYLTDLRDRTDETVKLGIPAGQQVIVAGWYPSERHPHGDHLGAALPIHASSLGRAILAGLPDQTARALLTTATMERLTPGTMTPTQAFRDLAEIRRRGYAINDQGTTSEHRSVAAALVDPKVGAVAAINVSVSAQRVSVADLQRQLAPLVVATARRISAVMPPHVEGAGWLRA